MNCASSPSFDGGLARFVEKHHKHHSQRPPCRSPLAGDAFALNRVSDINKGIAREPAPTRAGSQGDERWRSRWLVGLASRFVRFQARVNHSQHGWGLRLRVSLGGTRHSGGTGKHVADNLLCLDRMTFLQIPHH